MVNQFAHADNRLDCEAAGELQRSAPAFAFRSASVLWWLMPIQRVDYFPLPTFVRRFLESS
jgi:hypothetical protein